MKYFFLTLALCFIGISYAELPDVLKDPATREVAEYLDAKAQAAEKVTRNFSVDTATTTFSGWIDVGLETITSSCGAQVSCSATCSTGKSLLSGSCQSASSSYIPYAMHPSGGNSFVCSWASATGEKVTYAICARVK